jgi:hypothetical protein
VVSNEAGTVYLSPIDATFSKLKTLVRRLRAISVTDALAWFIYCGYLNIDQPV